jgi:hypothetical protein
MYEELQPVNKILKISTHTQISLSPVALDYLLRHAKYLYIGDSAER